MASSEGFTAWADFFDWNRFSTPRNELHWRERLAENVRLCAVNYLAVAVILALATGIFGDRWFLGAFALTSGVLTVLLTYKLIKPQDFLAIGFGILFVLSLIMGQLATLGSVVSWSVIAIVAHASFRKRPNELIKVVATAERALGAVKNFINNPGQLNQK